jgi:anti-sigma regulatory factor (Ser/Thr protein kinase)
MPATTAKPDAATAHYQASYHGRPDQVARVRAAVAAHLEDCPAADDAVLVVSEIVTNAVRHSESAGEFFCVRVDRHPAWVWIECEDLGGPWQSQTDEERPHGLSIVDALAEEWGVDGDTSGRVVWARLTW